MKTSLLVLTFVLAAPLYAQSEPMSPPPPSPATFDWKLRLVQGQTWTQTIKSRVLSRQTMPNPGSKPATKMESDITQTIALKNEVLSVSPEFSVVRSTYMAFDQKIAITLNGKPAPKSASSLPDMSKAFIGASFTIKQAPDGRVLNVSGLDDLLARQRKMVNSLFKTQQERAAFERFLPSASALKQGLAKRQGMTLPKSPLAVGQSYSYSVALPPPFALPMALTGTRTLRSLDALGVATFDENAKFSVAPLQITGQKAGTVVLTRDAAQMYALEQSKKPLNKRFGKSVQFYRSKNAGIYYRNPQTHQAIFVAQAAKGFQVRVPKEAAEEFKPYIGYNNQNKGFTFEDAFRAPSKASGARPDASHNPVSLAQEPKTFLAMSGTISGQTVVDAHTGLARSSSITTRVTGKVTVIEPNGHKTSVPIDATSQTTLSTTL